MMGDKTRIEWADATWSPVTGCTRISDGCLNCYIERSTPIRVAGRKFDGEGIGSSLAVQLHPNRLDWPLRKRDGKKIFVCSQADLFHDDVPDEYIARVFAVMAEAPRHTFQVLTKRHGRMRSLLSVPEWPRILQIARDNMHSEWDPRWDDDAVSDWYTWPLPNVWLGVSTEDQKHADLRIPALLDTPAAVRWISAEPLLGPIDLIQHFGSGPAFGNPAALDWVVAGGESGPRARPMHPDWARSLRDQCVEAVVPFQFKQWGQWAPGFSHGEGENGPGDTFVNLDGTTGHVWIDEEDCSVRNWCGDWNENSHAMTRCASKKRAGRELDGRIWDQFPEAVA